MAMASSVIASRDGGTPSRWDRRIPTSTASGINIKPICRIPREVLRSFQRRKVYCPAECTATVASKNISEGKKRLVLDNVLHKLITSPTEQTTMSDPLMSSIQRMLDFSMKAVRISIVNLFLAVVVAACTARAALTAG